MADEGDVRPGTDVDADVAQAQEYHPAFARMFSVERAHVEARWRARAASRGAEDNAPFDWNALRGLALSGGGIRSAAFCMGVVQRLHVSGVVDRLHYMSTVSGGGYTGAALTWFLSRMKDDKPRYEKGDKPLYETSLEGRFPFWRGEPAGVRNARDSESEAIDDDQVADGRKVLDYIRQRSSYLNPGSGFTLVSGIAIVLRSVLTSLFGFILLFALLFLLEHAISLFLGWSVYRGAELGLELPRLSARWPSAVALGLLGVLAFSIVAYSLFTSMAWATSSAYRCRRLYQQWAGRVIALALLLALLDALDWLMEYIRTHDLMALGREPLAFGGVTMTLGAIGGLFLRAARAAPSGMLKHVVMAALPPIALILLLIGLGIIGHRIADFAVAHSWSVVALVFAALLYSIWTNINLTSLHRLYRDRLMESFMPDSNAIAHDGQAAMTSADDFNLADCCQQWHDGPYHLINAHVVLIGASKARQRSRGGDSFLLSPLFCGSEATGFIDTRKWMPREMRIKFARRHGALKLPTAMAISGAALNPHASGDGQGPTKGGAVSALLNILNLRLGYWMPSPAKATRGGWMPSYRWPPNFLFPGLSQGLFGFRHNENAHWLELSDGGHFENTGIYELVRRRVRTIVFADGSTDPEIALASFANALEKIYIDFNVTVTFDETTNFTRMMKGMDSIKDALSERLNFSDAGFAIGTIHYRATADSPAFEGKLFYVKSTMVRNLPTALYSYKATNPLFPAESLADQFFSEQQFEAYRALGFALTGAMMEHVDSDWKDEIRKRPRLRAERAERAKLALADHLDLAYSWDSAKARWRAGASPNTPAGP